MTATTGSAGTVDFAWAESTDNDYAGTVIQIAQDSAFTQHVTEIFRGPATAYKFQWEPEMDLYYRIGHYDRFDTTPANWTTPATAKTGSFLQYIRNQYFDGNSDWWGYTSSAPYYQPYPNITNGVVTVYPYPVAYGSAHSTCFRVAIGQTFRLTGRVRLSAGYLASAGDGLYIFANGRNDDEISDDIWDGALMMYGLYDTDYYGQRGQDPIISYTLESGLDGNWAIIDGVWTVPAAYTTPKQGFIPDEKHWVSITLGVVDPADHDAEIEIDYLTFEPIRTTKVSKSASDPSDTIVGNASSDDVHINTTKAIMSSPSSGAYAKVFRGLPDAQNRPLTAAGGQEQAITFSPALTVAPDKLLIVARVPANEPPMICSIKNGTLTASGVTLITNYPPTDDVSWTVDLFPIYDS